MFSVVRNTCREPLHPLWRCYLNLDLNVILRQALLNSLFSYFTFVCTLKSVKPLKMFRDCVVESTLQTGDAFERDTSQKLPPELCHTDGRKILQGEVIEAGKSRRLKRASETHWHVCFSS